MPALYPTEEQIAHELFGRDKDALPQWRAVATVWQREGLPLPDPHVGRRYWPAVRAFLDRRAGLRDDSPRSTYDGEENFP